MTTCPEPMSQGNSLSSHDLFPLRQTFPRATHQYRLNLWFPLFWQMPSPRRTTFNVWPRETTISTISAKRRKPREWSYAMSA